MIVYTRDSIYEFTENNGRNLFRRQHTGGNSLLNDSEWVECGLPRPPEIGQPLQILWHNGINTKLRVTSPVVSIELIGVIDG